MKSLKVNNSHSDRTDQPRKILVIDDEESICLLLKEYLEILGHEVETELTGVKGLEALTQKEYELVICDVSMPGMDGFQVYERAIDKKPQQNFLFMTGFSFEGKQQKLVNRSLGLVKKPFQLHDLNPIISRVFSKG